ncbi:hypothetical protein GGH91_000495 [Coemansia sp. RSA 2671]|nr:hypothetical protein LPJ60_000466 [Coemansia sp. RSA 2675]KAJ2349960.1 hypothetical protein GGH91_000495 [Coemansia sp. RSA 2671]
MNTMNTVPDYILSSGIMAQLNRGRRTSLASITSASSAQQTEDCDEVLEAVAESSSEIKSVLGYISAPQRGWSQNAHYDTPRLVHF